MDNDIRVVIGIDFGTTFSGFAYAHKSNPNEISAHDDWKNLSGYYKTPTVLKYDESLKLVSWGLPALAEKQTRRTRNVVQIPVERFKLHLGKMENKNKPHLPNGIDYKTAITDYLREMTVVIKDTLLRRWDNIDFFKHVLIIMTVPAEFGQEAMRILRECAHKAQLINSKNSRMLKFTTEPEAAAIYCMNKLPEHNVGVGSCYMIVDCGGGTVDLTTRKLVENNKLEETVERKGDFCGGCFVDEEFLRFIGRRVGHSAIELVRKNHYAQLQYMVQEFCRRVKIPFSGQESDFQPFDVDLKDLCPALKQYVKGIEHENMEDDEWIIELTFEDVKSMFDPVIDKIMRLIHAQLNACSVSLILLVGGFSESKYLQERIKSQFKRKVPSISVPPGPMISIEKGAVMYGLEQETVKSRVLKWTYGTDILRRWALSDPIERKRPDGTIKVFDRWAKRGDIMDVNHQVSKTYIPHHREQTKMGFDVYVTEADSASYCDEGDGVQLLDTWNIFMPVENEERSISFTLIFGNVEIEAIAHNIKTGKEYKNTFDLE